MSERRIAAALVALLSIVYIKLAMPSLYEQTISGLRGALGEEQIALPVSEETAAWLAWD